MYIIYTLTNKEFDLMNKNISYWKINIIKLICSVCKTYKLNAQPDNIKEELRIIFALNNT